MKVYVGGAPVALDPARLLGSGGEADVYDVGGGRALKLFKPPGHPDFAGLPAEQEAARRRIELHQRKLRELPARLPPHVVAPAALATDRRGRRVLGYTMPIVAGAEVLLRYGDRGFRRAGGIADDTVVAVLRDLFTSVSALHARGVVIGDFNDLNVLVRGADAWLIDSDSFQFGPYRCEVLTERFADPLLLDGGRLATPFGTDSDWYAYTVMVMQALLFCGPYGGVHMPADPAARVPPAARPARRLTVFSPEVRYPRPARPIDSLPDALIEHLRAVFERDRRGPFPAALLADLRFATCRSCGESHARALCPRCVHITPPAGPEVSTLRGEVACKRLFATSGVIVHAAVDRGELRWLVHEEGVFRREDGSVALAGPLDRRLRFALWGATTLVGRDGRLAALAPGRPPEVVGADAFACADGLRVWSDGGTLWRAGRFGPEAVGGVLAGQTRLWTGGELGLGYYRAGELTVAFVFDPRRGTLRDGVALPPLRGRVVDTSCLFAGRRAWFSCTLQVGGRTVYQCALVDGEGTLLAAAQSESPESWLVHAGRGCAAGDALLVPGDDGVIRVEAAGDTLVAARTYPDSAPFVHSGCRLLALRDGLAVVDGREIRLLNIHRKESAS